MLYLYCDYDQAFSWELKPPEIMKKSRMTTEEILKTMNGCECNSLTFEGCVGVNNGKIYRDGKVIKATKAEIYELWEEYCYEELGNINDMF